MTAGTIFDKTRTPLRVWFAAAWYITNQKQGVSALGLQRVLGLNSYQTAWTMLHRFRRAMVRPDRDLPFGGQGRRSDGRTATKGFEFGIPDHAGGFIHFNLQTHYIPAFRCSHQSGAHIGLALVQRTHILGVLVMIDYFFTVCHNLFAQFP